MVKAGDILIAKPFLQDGHIKRSVIYMGEHSEEGSLGFILNKPHGLLLRDIFPHLKNGNFPLFDGGPVSPNQLFYTHTVGANLTDSVETVSYTHLDVYKRQQYCSFSRAVNAGARYLGLVVFQSYFNLSG